MNIASYSLYGSDQKYFYGAIQNAKSVNHLAGNWKSYFYCDASVPLWVINELENFGARVIISEPGWHANGMFWRFYPIHNERFERFIIRDVDSRISDREAIAIQSWIESGLLGHIMRDHPYHNTSILGGMWGARSDLRFELEPIDIAQKYTTEKGQDQNYLEDIVYPILKEQSLIHDSFYKHEPSSVYFPTSRINGEYVGEVVAADGGVDLKLRKLLMFYENHEAIWKLRRSLSSF